MIKLLNLVHEEKTSKLRAQMFKVLENSTYTHMKGFTLVGPYKSTERILLRQILTEEFISIPQSIKSTWNFRGPVDKDAFR